MRLRMARAACGSVIESQRAVFRDPGFARTFGSGVGASIRRLVCADGDVLGWTSDLSRSGAACFTWNISELSSFHVGTVRHPSASGSGRHCALGAPFRYVPRGTVKRSQEEAV